MGGGVVREILGSGSCQNPSRQKLRRRFETEAYTPRRRTEGWGRTGAGVLGVGRGKGLDVVVLPKRSVFRFGNY